jgi:hypothetical protein
MPEISCPHCQSRRADVVLLYAMQAVKENQAAIDILVSAFDYLYRPNEFLKNRQARAKALAEAEGATHA